ncbi:MULTISPECIES: hypothetical protein [Streptomyces]|uniref:Integral membrane protein n=1 Tax=Streptomyces albus (strain ATCC 21838 / DSM 41398 / FERM P-419 / JCM 4703 / NBRC 107858) TaxID=1081613 RepID=A0A0B5ELS2_STRA4|nr:hypothetical protein [Streptomyces sp. SCSIO ZS0520]AJE82519.1 hypothetical protein SLNWT_2143 [Streptomyces albus]AOU76834.1 hypothetical protein SLNHY_2143 [Streptomyces albus]AYN32612.1 hypothetical protein DUI70_2109 [Streptomyces albus]
MIVEALGSALLGLALAYLAGRLLADRLPGRNLVLPTGLAGGLLGAFLTHSALGAGHLLATLAGGVLVAAAVLSLLIRPRRMHHSAHA